MSTDEVRSNDSTVARVDMKIEAVVIPVSDVDRAKKFYGNLGWRLDADFSFDNGFRVVQFTPGRRALNSNPTERAVASAGSPPITPATAPSPRSATPTATAGRARAARNADEATQPELAGLVRRVHGARAGRRRAAEMTTTA